MVLLESYKKTITRLSALIPIENPMVFLQYRGSFMLLFN